MCISMQTLYLFEKPVKSIRRKTLLENLSLLSFFIKVDSIVLKKMFLFYSLFMICFCILNFCIGYNMSGDIHDGIAHVSLILSITGIMALYFIPGLGIFVTPFYYSIINNIAYLSGVNHGFWIDYFVINGMLILGLCIQTITLGIFFSMLLSLNKIEYNIPLLPFKNRR